ncbi:MAG: hypothetical protein JWR05_422 [Mucilaginibacter sp.]|nr:hypothetical protein [Mucilaginibacter sp.]
MQLLPIVVGRTPAFSLKDELEERWPDLKVLIADSSPSFYQIIKDLDAPNSNGIDNKINFSIWKYFNRTRSRATPYGTFAAFSTVRIMDKAKGPIIVDDKIIQHQFTNWAHKQAHVKDPITLVSLSTCFVTNSTMYLVGKEYRYVRINQGIFEVAFVARFAELDTILLLCDQKKNKEDICQIMHSKHGFNIKEVESLLAQMLSQQLILSERHPNITGDDYFERIKTVPPQLQNPYIISERKILSGGLDIKTVQEIPEMIDFLSNVLPSISNNDLNDFRKAFVKKFEMQAVSLSVAMDIEIGIGYRNLADQRSNSELLDFLDLSTGSTRQDIKITYSDFERFLLNSLVKSGTIRLEEYTAEKKLNESQLANTLSVLMRVYEGQPVIESAGGCTANALLGRFTIASTQLEALGAKIADIEIKSNPDILFFDIAYQGEAQYDNINRRKHLYPQEVPILTWSTSSSPITIDDILVMVRGAEIILLSKKYRKRMVPRLSSAYNYHRSDLAVYRFLCDLQHQQIKSDLNFKLQEAFPGLSCYPRVTYKSIIISPAKWLVPSSLSSALKNEVWKDWKLRLIGWLEEKKINFMFKAGFSDQTLCFDPCDNLDVDAFLYFCRQNSGVDIYIEEALLSSENSGIKHKSGKPVSAQFVLSYYHSNRIYLPYDVPDQKIASYHQTVSIPGGEWLYFEIYCHTLRSDLILTNQLTLFLSEVRYNLMKWFFIRYEDPKPHIRLRLQIKDQSQGYEHMKRLKELLRAECENSLVSDIQIKTYFRETDRYGASRIENVEKLFFFDSTYVLRVLGKTKSLNNRYFETIHLMDSYISFGIADIESRILFVRSVAEEFTSEFKFNQEDFKKINDEFKSLKPRLFSNETHTKTVLSPRQKKTLSIIFKTCVSKPERNKLLGDLLHMHINRLFNSKQRLHEAILYHFLLKVLMARRAILSNEQAKKCLI